MKREASGMSVKRWYTGDVMSQAAHNEERLMQSTHPDDHAVAKEHAKRPEDFKGDKKERAAQSNFSSREYDPTKSNRLVWAKYKKSIHDQGLARKEHNTAIRNYNRTYVLKLFDLIHVRSAIGGSFKERIVNYTARYLDSFLDFLYSKSTVDPFNLRLYQRLHEDNCGDKVATGITHLIRSGAQFIKKHGLEYHPPQPSKQVLAEIPMPTSSASYDKEVAAQHTADVARHLKNAPKKRANLPTEKSGESKFNFQKLRSFAKKPNKPNSVASGSASTQASSAADFH